MANAEMDATLEHLQARVDTLENVLCDLATDHSALAVQPRSALKRALQDAGIMGKTGSE